MTHADNKPRCSLCYTEQEEIEDLADIREYKGICFQCAKKIMEDK